MLSVAEPSKAGSLADLEVVLEVEDTQRLFHPVLWDLVALVALQHQVVSLEVEEEEASEGASMVEEEEVVSEVDSKIEEAMVVEEEEVLASEVDLEEVIVVGIRMEPPTALLHLTLRLDQEVVEVDLEETVVGLEEHNLQIAMGQLLVGMIRVAVVAHMMTETADTAAAAGDTAIEMREVEVEATWSR